MSDAYLVSVGVFDAVHQRSNPLYHAGFILMKGDKDKDGVMTNLQAVGSYGFYTHQVPREQEVTKFKKQLGMHLRWQGSYAELKEEDLKTVDLGFGLKLGKPIEITEDEKNQLLLDIEKQYARQNDFFKLADEKALADIKKKFPEFDPENRDSKNNNAAMKEWQISIIRHREEYYEQACKTQDLNHGDMIDETALASGAISEDRARKDGLKDEKGICLFNFDIGNKASTCKVLIIDFLIDSLRGDAKNIKDRRLIALSELKSEFYTGPFPRFNQDDASVIFDTRQIMYDSTSGSLAAPKRDWDDVRKGRAVCKLQFLAEQKYMSLPGESVLLNKVEANADSLKALQIMNENLHLVKRIMNSLLTIKPDMSSMLRRSLYDIDDVLDKMIDCGVDQNASRKTMILYHETIRKLEKSGVLNVLRISGFDKKIKFETSVVEEWARLKLIETQALKTEALTLTDLLGESVCDRGYRYFQQFFNPKLDKVEISQEFVDANNTAIVKNSALR